VNINSEHKGVVVCDLSVAVRKGEYHGDDKHEVRKLKQRKFFCFDINLDSCIRFFYFDVEIVCNP